MTHTINKLNRNIRGMLNLIKAGGGAVRIKHVKAPNVANAPAEGLQRHYLYGIFFDDLSSDTPLVRKASFTPQNGEFRLDRNAWLGINHAGGVDENTCRGLSCYARYAAGFTVVEITIGDQKFFGRAICSLQDRWNSNIGTARALAAALDDAYTSGSDLGKAWALYLGQRHPRRAERLLAILDIEEVAA